MEWMNAQEVSDANVTGVALMLAGAHGGLQLKPHGLMQITLDAAAVTPTEPPPISST